MKNVVTTNQKELLTISGYSGIGKTTLIQQIYKSIKIDNGYLLKGKFEQYKNDIPYYGLNDALGEFINYILLEDEDKINDFKRKIDSTLGENAKLMAEIIPELKYVININKELPSLNPQESQNRFNHTFLNFVKLICEFEGSIVLCLDDMQWADLATIKMIDNIMKDSNINNILIILSYRSNEVKNTHPLFLMLDDLKSKRVRSTVINLKPLLSIDVNEMVSDTLGIQEEKTRELSDLIKEKTNGNPFFTKEFIYNLYDENLLIFNSDKYEWDWDFKSIKEKNITDNVVDLILKKISYLSEDTIDILKLASCLGSIQIEKISRIFDFNKIDVKKAVQEALTLGILLPAINKIDTTKQYKFSHDKVNESINFLMSQEEKELTHLKIGDYAVEFFDKYKIENRIFSITDHLNKGLNQIKDESKRLELSTVQF